MVRCYSCESDKRFWDHHFEATRRRKFPREDIFIAQHHKSNRWINRVSASGLGQSNEEAADVPRVTADDRGEVLWDEIANAQNGWRPPIVSGAGSSSAGLSISGCRV